MGDASASFLRRIWTVWIALLAWMGTAIPAVSFIWSVLGTVSARHYFLREFADFLVMSLFFGAGGSLLVLPVALLASRNRSGGATVALVAWSLVVYGATNFLALAYYSLRIT